MGQGELTMSDKELEIRKTFSIGDETFESHEDAAVHKWQCQRASLIHDLANAMGHKTNSKAYNLMPWVLENADRIKALSDEEPDSEEPVLDDVDSSGETETYVRIEKGSQK